MKIMMISWEYPPKYVGGLSNHLYHLCNSLSRKGNEINILTSKEGNTKEYEEINEKIYVHRLSNTFLEERDFLKWVMHLNFCMIEKGIEILNKYKIDVIHAHDWSSAYAAIVLSKSFNKKLITTIHSTEYGRNNGINGELQNYIYNVEKTLCKKSNKIIVCSSYMKNEILKEYGEYEKKIVEIPNGVEEKKVNQNILEFRNKYAPNGEKVLFYVGRHVYEKGIQVLIEAVAKLKDKYLIELYISGVGSYTYELKKMVIELNMKESIHFIGFISEELKNKFYSFSDIAVFPSLYEPFGIVALESMMLECPVIVSDIGGLGEIVKHRKNGLKFQTGSSENLMYCIRELLDNKELSNQIRINAKQYVLDRYTWISIAEKTIKEYSDLMEV